MLAGFLGTALLSWPIYEGVTRFAHPDLAAAAAAKPIVVAADPDGCSRQFDPFGVARFESPGTRQMRRPVLRCSAEPMLSVHDWWLEGRSRLGVSLLV